MNTNRRSFITGIGSGAVAGVLDRHGVSRDRTPSSHLTACMVNYNGQHYLEDSLGAIATYKEKFNEILLIDNDSTDRSLEITRDRFPDVKVIQLDKNYGPGTARNVGFASASCDRILFVDNDAILAPNCIDRLMQALDDNPQAVVAMPCVLYAHDKHTIQYDGADNHFLGLMMLHNENQPVATSTTETRKISSVVNTCFLVDAKRWGSGRPYFLAHWTLQQRMRRARQMLVDRGCHRIILDLWRPRYEPALNLIDYDLSCYHIDDEYTFSEVEKPVEEHEARVISRVDQVFTYSPALMEKKGKLNPRTAFVPNGVDYRAYSASYSEPADLSSIPRPRIGYVGIIKKQLDFDLLIALARRHQQWSFVLVGPQRNEKETGLFVQEFSRIPNVYLLGGKPVGNLPAYTQHLDVCVMCYRVNDYTKYIYPLKLHEYLASGRPVVGAPIRSLQEFAHVVRLARTVDEWSQALTESLAPAACSAAHVDSRRSVASRHDWDTLVRLTVRTLCDRLGPSYLERFEEISPNEHTVPDVIGDGRAVSSWKKIEKL